MNDTPEEMTAEEVSVAIKHIEGYYMHGTAVDLVRMSSDTNMYSTWLRLRNRQRDLKREAARAIP